MGLAAAEGAFHLLLAGGVDWPPKAREPAPTPLASLLAPVAETLAKRRRSGPPQTGEPRATAETPRRARRGRMGAG